MYTIIRQRSKYEQDKNHHLLHGNLVFNWTSESNHPLWIADLPYYFFVHNKWVSCTSELCIETADMEKHRPRYSF